MPVRTSIHVFKINYFFRHYMKSSNYENAIISLGEKPSPPNRLPPTPPDKIRAFANDNIDALANDKVDANANSTIIYIFSCFNSCCNFKRPQ